VKPSKLSAARCSWLALPRKLEPTSAATAALTRDSREQRASGFSRACVSFQESSQCGDERLEVVVDALEVEAIVYWATCTSTGIGRDSSARDISNPALQAPTQTAMAVRFIATGLRNRGPTLGKKREVLQ